MKHHFFGYLWTISECIDGGKDVADLSDRFAIIIKKQGRNNFKYHVWVPDRLHKVGTTLGVSNDWRYDPVDYDGQRRHVVRGNVTFAGHGQGHDHGHGRHDHHIFMVYPDPYSDEDELTGYILKDDQHGKPANDVLDELDPNRGGQSHSGTYHSGD